MRLSNERAGELMGGVWMIGLGILFWTGAWWPGIMFVIGISSILQGLVEGKGWYAFQTGFWTIAIGVWALYRFNIAVFFLALGASMVLLALVRPPAFEKPKPFADHSMD